MTIITHYKALRRGGRIELFDPIHGCNMDVVILEINPFGAPEDNELELAVKVARGVYAPGTELCCRAQLDPAAHLFGVHVVDDYDSRRTYIGPTTRWVSA